MEDKILQARAKFNKVIDVVTREGLALELHYVEAEPFRLLNIEVKDDSVNRNDGAVLPLQVLRSDNEAEQIFAKRNVLDERIRESEEGT